jgi:PhnB protein
MSSSLNPYLALEGTARQAMEFYQDVLGGALSVVSFGDAGVEVPHPERVMHALLVTPAGYRIMASDTQPGMPHTAGDTVAVSLSGDDPDLPGHFDGLARDGEVLVPFARQAWGDDYGLLRDRFGVTWHVNHLTPRD